MSVANFRGPDWASGVGYERGSGNLAFEVEENTLEVVLVEGSVAPRSRVDLAGDALGVVVDTAEETVAKELPLVASDAQVVLDVPGGLFVVKGPEVVADGDALVEGFVGSVFDKLKRVLPHFS